MEIEVFSYFAGPTRWFSVSSLPNKGCTVAGSLPDLPRKHTNFTILGERWLPQLQLRMKLQLRAISKNYMSTFLIARFGIATWRRPRFANERGRRGTSRRCG